MSKKIEKLLREAAEEEHKKILEDNQQFFDEVLMPEFEKQRADAPAAKKKNSGLRLRRIGALATAITAVVIVVSMLWVFLPDSPGDNGIYLGPFETSASNLEKVNECLKQTRISGEFGEVILSSDKKTGKPMLFSMSHEVTYETSLIEVKYELLVERSLTCDLDRSDYDKRLSFLGFTVEFKEVLSLRTYEETPVSEFNIKAYFDTGAERYYISYYEITSNETFSFADYLNAIIKKL